MWTALAALGGAYLGYKGTKQQNVASAQQAEKQMAFQDKSLDRAMSFQERMSNTAHQRQVQDLRAAGLNPILSSKYGGSSTPSGATASGAMAPQFNKYQVALQNAQSAATVANLKANARLTNAKADVISPGSTIFGELGDQIQEVIRHIKGSENKIDELSNSAIDASNKTDQAIAKVIRTFKKNGDKYAVPMGDGRHSWMTAREAYLHIKKNPKWR